MDLEKDFSLQKKRTCMKKRAKVQNVSSKNPVGWGVAKSFPSIFFAIALQREFWNKIRVHWYWWLHLGKFFLEDVKESSKKLKNQACRSLPHDFELKPIASCRKKNWVSAISLHHLTTFQLSKNLNHSKEKQMSICFRNPFSSIFLKIKKR